MVLNIRMLLIVWGVLFISLIIGMTAYAETITDGKDNSKITNHSVKQSIEKSMTEDFLNNSSISSEIDMEKIENARKNFSLSGAKANIQEKSITLFVIWIIIAGILFFINPKWAIGLMVGGAVGFIFINYPEEILGWIRGGIDWVFS
ncbi:hypothetical protein [Calidifontibacillus erzurumensis]|uniref:hypothetical protein n=1 Tax=Calidifontibacillus erzurumensis TaxID=2741433 RepID=UPI0035B545D4